jgi:uncharacterized protein Veg
MAHTGRMSLFFDKSIHFWIRVRAGGGGKRIVLTSKNVRSRSLVRFVRLVAIYPTI